MTPSLAPKLASNTKTYIHYLSICLVFGLWGEFPSTTFPSSAPSDVRNLKWWFYLTPKVAIKIAQAYTPPLSDNFFSFNEESLLGIS